MNKAEFLELFKQCVEDGNIVIGLEKGYEYHNYLDIYPRVIIKNIDNEEVYDSKSDLKDMGITINK